MVQNNLIFDFGFHRGNDSDFYLEKGFHVVALEADPDLVEQGVKRFAKEIEDGRLTLIHKAVGNEGGETTFYVHPTKKDWSSCLRELAESDGSAVQAITVEQTSLLELCSSYGVPRYLKVDIEGHDVFVARQLSELDVQPAFVSFESGKRHYAELFCWLWAAGYRSFQLVNQANHVDRRPDETNTKTEGQAIDYSFSPYSSGFFGDDLPEDRWLTLNQALTRHIKYNEMKTADNQELGLGWLDIHARL